MKVFFDTNVLLNGALSEAGGMESDACIRLCQKSHGFQAWIAWHTLSNAHYIIRARSKSPPLAMQFIEDLLAWTEIAPTTKSDALKAVTLGMSDFEDALQIASALACDADLILTRNIVDFKTSPVPVMTPAEFLTRFSSATQD